VQASPDLTAARAVHDKYIFLDIVNTSKDGVESGAVRGVDPGDASQNV
jgi:hypothetical protein